MSALLFFLGMFGLGFVLGRKWVAIKARPVREAVYVYSDAFVDSPRRRTTVTAQDSTK